MKQDDTVDEVLDLRSMIAKLKKLSALAINQMCGSTMFSPRVDGPMLRQLAVKEKLFKCDDLHHAPLCPANHWHQKQLPTGDCTCGASPAAESS